MIRTRLVSTLALVAALGLGAPASLAGGVGTIEGTVVDGGGTPLRAGVRVVIRCGAVTRTATLDARGNFSVAGLPEGTCTITGTGAGFGTTTLSVTIGAGTIATVLVGMTPPRPPEVYEAVPAAAAVPEPEPMAAEGVDDAPRPAKPMAPRLRVAPEARPMAAPPMPPPPPREVRDHKDVGRERLKLAKKELRAMDEELDVMAGEQIAAERAIADAGGFAPVRVFPVPQYTRGYEGPRTDFRETIYWNPTVTTDDRGTAEVTFVMSDAVTGFRATLEGFSAAGSPGRGELTLQSKLPLTLDARLPVEVTAGDTIKLPVTLANETEAPLMATLDASFGSAFKLTSSPVSGPIRLAAGEKRAVFFPLEVVATRGTADVQLAARAGGLADELTKQIRVVPRGFPFEVSAAGTAKRGTPTRHRISLDGALAGSIDATVTMFPSPVATLATGMEGMIREPGGCFEQTSATNYPNIMILSYLQSHDAADPALVDKTQGTLARGYKLLAGYETKQRGYEWFGNTPGHEALTAYGLMEFADMSKVYDVDRAMVERTADWLMARRDGKGGFQRSSVALDSFGRAGEATTNAYIMWALAEARRTTGLDKELAAQRELGTSTRDPYLLALAANTALLAAPTADATATMVKRLAAMQGKDGSFDGAKESITMSGGESLTIETTSLATLALLKASPNNEYAAQVRAAADWLASKRGGYGAWGNTQATVLGLKALTAYAEASKQMPSGGAATLIVNGKRLQTITFEQGRKDALTWDDLAGALVPGNNVVEVELDSDAALPYAIAISYRAARPQSSPAAKLAVSTRIARNQVRQGDAVPLRVHVENTTADGLPMTLARIGLPGGLVFQTWQLKELRDKGVIDFYETRPREVILYWRALPPSAKKDLELALLAQTPGTYEAPASSAYLYYTAEDKAWSAPVRVAIE